MFYAGCQRVSDGWWLLDVCAGSPWHGAHTQGDTGLIPVDKQMAIYGIEKDGGGHKEEKREFMCSVCSCVRVHIVRRGVCEEQLD